jgi:hypothetical protein
MSALIDMPIFVLIFCHKTNFLKFLTSSNHSAWLLELPFQGTVHMSRAIPAVAAMNGGTNFFPDDKRSFEWTLYSYQAFSQEGVQASWDAPRTKSGRLWTPKLWGEREIIFNDSLSILAYPKRKASILIIIIHLTFWSIWWCTWLNENVVVK